MHTRQDITHRVQDAPHDSPIIDFLHMEPILVAISMTITFCLLWFLIVSILYQLTRTALPTTL